jgi:hypothetical protein
MIMVRVLVRSLRSSCIVATEIPLREYVRESRHKHPYKIFNIKYPFMKTQQDSSS